LRGSPQGAGSAFSTRVTPGAVMKQSARHFNLNTGKTHGHFA
jgi:hypothetical protein